MGRHELRGGDLLVLDRAQRVLGVEAAHHDRGRADPLHRRREADRRGVVERRGRQVDVVLADPEEGGQADHAGQHRRVSRGDARQRAPHALGLAGGARRVEHDRALELVRERGVGGHARERLLERLEAGDLAADREPLLELGRARGDPRGQLGEARVRDEQLRVAVVDDVLDLVLLQVPVHRREVEPHPVARPVEVEELVVVREVRGDAVARLEPRAAQPVRDPSRAPLELAVGLDPLAVAVDQRRLVGTLLRNRGHCRHGALPPSHCLANALHSTRGAATLARMPDAVRDLLAFIDASPTPYHAIAETVRRLAAGGFRECSEAELWSLSPGDRRWVVRNGGSLIAFQVGSESPVEGGFRIVGAHSDSPNLRAKPLADLKAARLPPARGRAVRRDPPAHLARPRPLARGPRDPARRRRDAHRARSTSAGRSSASRASRSTSIGRSRRRG